MKPTILVAGGTGNLGERIIKALIARGAEVRAIVRNGSKPEKIKQLTELGAKVITVDMSNVEELKQACQGASFVVSALAGLHDVIVDSQPNCSMPRSRQVSHALFLRISLPTLPNCLKAKTEILI